MAEPLTWESTYAIALALRREHPRAELVDISLRQIYHMVLKLPDFKDDPGLANDAILTEIYHDWLEETLHDG